MATHTNRWVRPFLFAAIGIAVGRASSSAGIITYGTTLTVTPVSVTIAGSHDDDGTFYPTHPGRV